MYIFCYMIYYKAMIGVIRFGYCSFYFRLCCWFSDKITYWKFADKSRDIRWQRIDPFLATRKRKEGFGMFFCVFVP